MTPSQPRGPRPSRKGKGLIPPNPKYWEAEHHALDVRAALALPLSERLPVLDAFSLIPGARVSRLSEHPSARVVVDHFLKGEGSKRWSGLAVPLPQGCLVLVNDSHSETRIRSTLMEEFFHLWLGQPPSVIRIHSQTEHVRTRDPAVEHLAFAAGAACLVPFKALKEGAAGGKSVADLATQFGVSMSLISYRMQVTKIASRTSRIGQVPKTIEPPAGETSDSSIVS